MAHIYFEDYLESVEHLPSEFRELFTQIREKDLHYQEQRQRAAKKQAAYSKAVRRMLDMEGQEGMPAKIRAEYTRALELLDEKIELEHRATELMNKHIKRLEHDLKQFEQEMEEEKKKLDQAGAEIMGPDKRSMKRRAMDAAAAAAAAAAAVAETKTPSRKRKADVDADASDGGVDPNEPVYCFCQQVSYGEMVACDNNEKCPYSWFHFPCVGLTSQPSGKWYCSECLVKKKKLLVPATSAAA